MKARLRLLWFVWFGLCLAGAAAAQSIFGSLTGIVSDASGAVVPDAKVTLTNEASGDTRRTATNAEGYFSIVSIPTGTYTVQIEAPGFQKWERKGISFTGAERRTLNDIVLQVAAAAEQVQVTATVEGIAPVESGEKAAVLTTRQLQEFSVVGRSAAEFIKILPGFAIANTGVENRQNFTGEVIGINGNGDAGSQSALNNAYQVNGLPASSLDITADGAHVSDPGCNCATPVNPNTDMIQELKVLTSNYSAENAKGPAVINTVAKAGGREFHGQGYLYARHYALNANDWLNNRFGTKKPENKFLFPGGNIGGPVRFPGSNFNKNRDKMFFFTGFEYFYQTLDTGVLTATVPTEGMRNGNFSPAELARLGQRTASGAPPSQLNADSLAQFPGGIIPASMQDPSGRNLIRLFPLPNADSDATGGFNYVRQIVFNQNGWQWLSRVDYSISDYTKLFVRYNAQRETQRFPVGLWWRNANQVPYPTEILGKNRSDSISASLTHVFNPTLTNELVFGYTYITFPNVFDDPRKVDRAALNIPFRGLYKNGVAQIPSLLSWGGEFAQIFNPGGFEVGGSKGLFADKHLPSISNNLSKVWSTHTMKFGFYYEYVINNQPANGDTNGRLVQANWAGNTSGNPYADLLLGRVAEYGEQNLNPLHNEAYHTVEFFAQDSWKVTRRLTLELGLRASHLGNWFDREGIGFAVWDPASYDNSPGVPPERYTGLLWHKRDPRIPLSGFPNKQLSWAPRFGMALDLFGTGRTVLRGGWGAFYYHNAQFTTGLDAPAGVQLKTIGSTTFSSIEGTDPGVGAIGTGALDPTDDKVPLTYSWSFTISQRAPFSSLVELSYVGNESKNVLNNCGVGTNVNAVPFGALFNIGTDPNGLPNLDAFRPLRNYQNLCVVRHNLYQNYHAFQASWLRQIGKYLVQANYTYGKNLGINSGDEFSLRNNYGPLPNDRRHIFNVAYSIELPSPVRSHRFAKGLVNGWQLSGITQVQSGVNLTGNTGNSFNINPNNFQMANGYAVTNRTINGTDAVALRPIVTCDPRKGLGKNQYVNGNCFALPTVPGANGPIIPPEVFGPAFFNSDLSLFKNFQFSESRKLQLRFSAYNFLNHPLWTFRNAGSNLNLVFNPATGKLDNPNFGVATEKLGRRIIQLAVKYYF